jgi:hypothetical protein
MFGEKAFENSALYYMFSPIGAFSMFEEAPPGYFE